MTVKSILDEKGRDVVTVSPDMSLVEAARMLASRKIGALVVTKSEGRIIGILSERDIVLAVGMKGAAALDASVASAMTARVSVCNDHHSVNDVMEIMTRGRFRHVPVEKNGQLAGIISIGDVVKQRIEEAEREANEIRAYIATA